VNSSALREVFPDEFSEVGPSTRRTCTDGLEEMAMGKLVVTEFVSLDGVFEDPGGSEGTPIAGWTFAFDRGDEGNKVKFDELLAADAQLFGRVTYEGFAEAWPSRTDEAGFADRINSLPKYVVSTTLQKAEWQGSTIIRDNVAAEVQAIKDRYDGDILVAGSGTLVRSLLADDLVDELKLMVFPSYSGRVGGCSRRAPPTVG
jgi:dihydrofolate reductase